MPQHPLAISPDDVAVSLSVREELGAAAEPAVIAEFLERVSTAIDERVDAQLAKVRLGHRSSGLPVVSLVMGIPITAIAGDKGIVGILLAWTGIVAVNVADALRC